MQEERTIEGIIVEMLLNKELDHANTQNALLRRLIFLLILSSVVLSALAYPLRLPNLLLAYLDQLAEEQRSTWGGIYFSQLRSYVAFNYSPLILKETVGSSILIGALCFLLLYTMRTISIQQLYNVPVAMEAQRRSCSPILLVREPIFWAGLFLTYTAISVFLLSPTLHYSLRTWILCALGISAFITLVVIRPTWYDVQKFMVAVALTGTLIAFVSFLQHVDAAWWFLPNFDDPRNRLGSFIGHNTGLSAFLLFPLSFSISLWFIVRRRITRLLISAAILLMLFVLVAAQSRAIWVLGTGMVVWQISVLAREFLKTVRKTRIVLSVVALILALAAVQSVAPSVNPLARHTVRIGERLRRDFSPSQLVKETRLRIFVVSLPLIARSPLWGHGFGAFQYVYPPAHGEYFLRHPDSVLGTTTRRTDVAHNDYLQLVVECGLLGALLLLVPLGLVLKETVSMLRRLSPSREKILSVGLIAPLGAIAIHAFFDFPMHVYPIALLTVVTLGMGYSLARASQNPSSVPVQAVGGESLPSRRSFRAELVISLCAVVAMWLLSPLGYEFLLRTYVSDCLARDASNWVVTAKSLATSSPAAAFEAISRAKELFHRAIKMDVFNGSALEGLAALHVLAGHLDFMTWSSLSPEEKNSKQGQALRQNIVRNFSAATQYAKLAIERGELRYHYLFYLIGQSYHMLWQVQPETPQFLESARKALEEAIALNNADVGSLLELSNVYEKMNPPDEERARSLRRRIFDVDPVFGAKTFLDRVDTAAEAGRFVDAWKVLNKITEAVGDHWSVRFAHARLYLKEALWYPPSLDRDTSSPQRASWKLERLKLAGPIVRELEEKIPDNLVFRHFLLRYLAACGETTRALALADRLILETETREPELDVLRYELGLKASQPRSLRWVEKDSAEFWYYRQRLRTLVFDEVPLGSAQLANMVREDKALELQREEGLRACAYLRAAGRWDLVLVIAENLARNYPVDPDVRKILEEARTKAREKEK